MFRILRNTLISFILVLLVVSGCQIDQFDQMNEPAQDGPKPVITRIIRDIPAAKLEGDGLCGQVIVNPLYSLNCKKGVGYISIGNDENNLYVNFETVEDWTLHRIYLYVGPENEVPVNPWGMPKVGQFPVIELLENRPTDYTVTIPLNTLGEDISVAAFVIVGKYEQFRKYRFQRIEGAWGHGQKQIGKYWGLGWLYNYTLQECAPPPPPDPDGCLTAWNETPNSYPVSDSELGWYDVYIATEEQLTKVLYAGSGNNPVTDGTPIGNVFISYYGEENIYYLDVSYLLSNPDYLFSDVHLYIGNEAPSMAPADYPYIVTDINAAIYQFSFTVEYDTPPSEFPTLFIAAQALVCPVL